MKKTTKYFTIFALLIMVLSLGIGVAKWNIHYQKPIDTSINTGPTHGEGDGKIDLIDYYINVADDEKVADPYQYQMASGGGIANGSVEYSYQYDPNYTQGPSLSMDGAQYNLQGSTKPSTVNDLTDTMFEESYRLNRVPFSAAKKTGGRHMIDKGFNSELVVEYDDENNVMTVTVNYTVAGRSTVYSNQLTLNYDGSTPSTTNETVIEGVGYSYFNANYDGESAYSLTFVFGKDKNFNLGKRSFGRFYTVPTNTNDCWTTEKPKNAGIYTYKVKVKDTEANPYLIDGGEKTVDFAILPKMNDGTTSCTYESPSQTQMLSYRLADSLGNAETATIDGETVYFVTYNGATFDIQIEASGTDNFEVGIHGNTSEVSNGQKEILRSGDTLKFADDSAVTLNHCNVAQAWSENPNFILTNPYRYYLILPAKFENVNVPDFTKDFNPNTETLAGIPYTIDQNELQATCTSINGQTATWSFSKNNASFASSLTATNVADSGEYYYKIEADNHVPATGSFTVTINKFKVNVPGKDTTTFVYSASEQTYTPVAVNGHDIYYTVSTNKRTDAGNQDVTVTLKYTDNYEWSASLPTYTFTIAPAPLSVKADDKSITYGDEAPVYTATYSGFVGGENKDVLTGTLTLACTYAKGNDAGTYPITPSGLSSTNYEITFDGGTLTVERKGLVRPTASVKTYTYNGSAQKFELSGFDSSTMGVSNDTHTNAGSQQVVISIKNKTNYCWSDKSDSDFELTFTIVGKTISLNWSNTTLTYNGDPQKPTAEATGVISGDTVAVTVEGAQTAAGNYTATVSINNVNYVLDNSKTQSFTIEPKEITVVWNVGTYVYSGDPQGPTATATGLIGNDTLTLTVKGYGTDAGDHTAVVEAFTSGNYKLSSNSEKAYTIEKQPISGSFKFNKTEYVETHTGNPISVLTDGGVQIVNSDGSAINTNLFKVEYSGDVSATEVGNYTLTATVSAASSNYSMTPDTINFDWSIKASVLPVEKVTDIKDDAPLEYEGKTFAAESYVDANAGYTVTFKLNGQVTTPRNAGDYTVVISLNDGYQWADGSTEDITLYFTIAKATLTVTPSADDIPYGGTPIFSRTITGFKGDDVINDVDIGNVLPDYETNYDKKTNGNVGEYTISITNNPYTATNYNFNYVEGSFRVTALTVAAPESKIANGTSVQYSGTTYTAESFYVSSAYYTVKINGGSLSEFSAVGTYTITVELNANYAWSGNAPGEISFTITEKLVAVPTLNLSNAPAGITVAWGQTASFPYDGKDHELTVTGSGEGYTVTYTNGQIGRTTGSYGVTVELVNGNYAWSDGSPSSLTYTYTIDKIVVTIPSPDTTAIPYDTNPHTFSVTASDYYTSTPVTGTNAGTYTVTASLNDTTNYIWSDVTTAQKSFTFTISKASLTITAKSYSINLGQAAPNYEVTYSEFAGTETSAVLGGNLVLTCDYNPTTSSVGEYAIIPSGLTSTNYEIKYVAGTLTVSKQSVTKPTSAGKTYTYNNANQTFVLNNFDANTMTVSNNVQKNADTYTVTVSLKDTANYQWADGTTDPLTFSFVINKKEINLDGDKYTITWDGETGSTGTDFTYYWANTLIAPVATITDLETTEEINLKFVSSNIQGLGGVNKWNAGDYKAIISQSTALESENYTLVGSATFEQRYKISKILLKVGGEQYDNYTSGGITTTNNAKLVKNYTIYTAGATLPSGFTLTVTIDDGSGATAMPSTIKVGNTYKIIYTPSSVNVGFVNDENYFYYKYKTAYLGTDTSTYYTIEEAFNTNSTTYITLAGIDGNPANATSYVTTSFTKLDYYEKLYGNNSVYSLSNRKLIVPHAKGKTTHDLSDSASSGYVYSALIVTDNVTINLSNSASINVCAIIGYKQPSTTIVAQRGVMMNNGTINVASGCTVNAYGFIKGSGKLNLANGSTAIDCIRTYDFPGGTAGMGMYRDVFPANAWTAHNISCETKIMSGAIYKSILNVKVLTRIDATATIIGTSGSCFFKPTAINDNTYLIKTTTDLPNATNLSTIGGSNQIAGQKELFELYGSWTDSSFSLSVSLITFETSEEKPAPMGFVDVTLKSGSSLTISNSSYMFMPGTKLIIEENATLTCNKRLIFLRYSDLPDATSYANYRFITYCKDTDDAEADVYGTMVINGSVGGRINPMSTTARLNISGAVESTYRSLSATDSPYYKEDSVPAVFGDEDTPTPLESLFYEGVVDSTLGFAWSSVSGLPTYTITRDLNDGSSPPSSQLYSYSGEAPVITSLPAVERDYYTFSGWTYNGSLLSESNPINVVQDTTYTVTANWTPITYTIKYKAYLNNSLTEFEDDYTNENATSLTIESGKITLKSAVATGYTFDGWYIVNTITNEDISIPVDTEIYVGAAYGGFTFGKDITELELVCYFKEMYDVEYYVNGVVKRTDKVLAGKLATEPDTLLAELNGVETDSKYYTGWFTDPGCTQIFYFTETTITQNTRLYAKAEEGKKTTITLTLNANGGTIANYDTPKTVYVLSGKTKEFSLEYTATRTGYTFSEWNTSEDGSGTAYSGSIELSQSTTLYAQWTVNSYTITVTTSNATVTGVTNGQSVQYGTTVSVTVSFSQNNSKTLTVKDADGTILSESAAGTYTFTMPASNVTIEASSRGGCFTLDTLVTLADGTQRRVDQLTYYDEIVVWDFVNGRYTTAKASIIENHGYDTNTVIRLTFEDGTVVKVVNVHGFFNADTNKWVDINRDNAESFIGTRFVQASGSGYTTVKLAKVDITVEYIEAWSLLTIDHYNCIVEGMFSITPPATEQLCMFEIGENMTYDAEKMAADIEKYGLYTYEEFAHLVSKKAFDAFNIAEIKVAVGKGLITYEEVVGLCILYGSYMPDQETTTQ